MAKASRAPLSRERVLEGARTVLAREGLEGLTMRALGRELDAEAMAVYYYFPSKNAILDELVDDLARQVEVPAPGSIPWQQAMRVIVRSFRTVAREHPEASQLLVTHPRPEGKAVDASRSALNHLVESGFDEHTALLAYRSLSSYAWGAIIEDSRSSPLSTGDRDGEFEFGLDALIVGLESALSRLSTL